MSTYFGCLALPEVDLWFIYFCFRIEAKDPVSAIDARYEYFVKEILPQYKDSIMAHTMIYVPSYFDFVRIRNYFKKEDLSFVQICEYSKVITVTLSLFYM